MLSRLFKAVLNACMPLKTRRSAFPIVKSNTEVKMYDLLDSFLYLPELASVVEFRMCQRSLFTPSFLPLYKLFTTDLATRGIREIRLAGLRVLEFLLPPPPWLQGSCALSHGNLIQAGEILQSPFSLHVFLVHCFRRSISNLKLTEAIARQVCSQCFQIQDCSALILLWSIYYINYMYLSSC